MQCPQDDTEKLEEALRRTTLIDWQKYIIIPFTPYHVVHSIQRALGENLELETLKSNTFIYDKPTNFTGTE